MKTRPLALRPVALIIRPAVAADHRALEALLAKASLATGEHAEELRANPEAFEIPAANLVHTLVAVSNERILGFCTILRASGDSAEVDSLFVEPGAWRTGLGRSLLAAVARRASAEGVTTLSVVSGRYARPFYEAQGFHHSETEMTRFGPAVRLVKTLVV